MRPVHRRPSRFDCDSCHAINGQRVARPQLTDSTVGRSIIATTSIKSEPHRLHHYGRLLTVVGQLRPSSVSSLASAPTSICRRRARALPWVVRGSPWPDMHCVSVKTWHAQDTRANYDKSSAGCPGTDTHSLHIPFLFRLRRHHVGSGSSPPRLGLPLPLRRRRRRYARGRPERAPHAAHVWRRRRYVRRLGVRAARHRAGHDAGRHARQRNRVSHRAGAHRLLPAVLRRQLRVRPPRQCPEGHLRRGCRILRVRHGVVARRLCAQSWRAFLPPCFVLGAIMG
jgi:hypothetical protein